MMKKILLIIGVIVVLALVSLPFWNRNTVIPIGTGIVPALSGKDFSYTNETETTIVQVELKTTGFRTTDSRIQSEVMTMARGFEQESSPEKFTATEKQEFFTDGRKWTANWSGDIVSRFAGFTNYRVDSYSYTGGAHGNPALATYVLDTEGNELFIGTLFQANSDYLTLLSSLSRDMLRAGNVVDQNMAEQLRGDYMLSPEMIDAGTTPDEVNFRNFTIESDGLHILFNSYQVAPYAAGQPEISIPWSKLSSVLDPAVLSQVNQ